MKIQNLQSTVIQLVASDICYPTFHNNKVFSSNIPLLALSTMSGIVMWFLSSEIEIKIFYGS